MLDSTQELLHSDMSNSPLANRGGWAAELISRKSSDLLGGDDDDFSLYSDFDESAADKEVPHLSSISNLSNLYDLLQDDSIEMRRSTSMVDTSSPLKASSARTSPTKKLRNDYQDQLYRARSGSQSAPKKKPLRPFNANLPTTAIPNLGNDFFNESTFDTIEKNIEQFLKSQDDAVLSTEDKTELLIRETHKLVTNIPSTILPSKEGEKYSQVLTNSINKVVASLESLKSQNKKLVEETATCKSQMNSQLHDITNLQTEVAVLKREKEILKDEKRRSDLEIEQYRRKIQQQEPQYNSQLKRENSLLREKLIKYKKIADEGAKEILELKSALQKNKKNDAQPSNQHFTQIPKAQNVSSDTIKIAEFPSSESHSDQHGEGTSQLRQIYDQISEYLKKKPETPAQESHSTYDYKMLPVFEELIQKLNDEVNKNKKKETPPHKEDVKQDNQAQSSPAAELSELQKLSEEVERLKTLARERDVWPTREEIRHEVKKELRDEIFEDYRQQTTSKEGNAFSESRGKRPTSSEELKSQSNTVEEPYGGTSPMSAIPQTSTEKRRSNEASSTPDQNIILLYRMLSTMDRNNNLYAALLKLLEEYKNQIKESGNIGAKPANASLWRTRGRPQREDAITRPVTAAEPSPVAPSCEACDRRTHSTQVRVSSHGAKRTVDDSQSDEQYGRDVLNEDIEFAAGETDEPAKQHASRAKSSARFSNEASDEYTDTESAYSGMESEPGVREHGNSNRGSNPVGIARSSKGRNNGIPTGFASAIANAKLHKQSNVWRGESINNPGGTVRRNASAPESGRNGAMRRTAKVDRDTRNTNGEAMPPTASGGKVAPKEHASRRSRRKSACPKCSTVGGEEQQEEEEEEPEEEEADGYDTLSLMGEYRW